MAAPVRELDPRPDHQVLHRLGNCDSSLGRSSHHTGGDVDGDTPDAPIQHLDLTCVEASSDLDPERPDGIGKLLGTPHGPCGAVEGGQEAITGRLDLSSAEAVEVCTYQPVVGLPQVEPSLVSQRRGPLRRAHYVGEQ
jgi:hypothetical protein